MKSIKEFDTVKITNDITLKSIPPTFVKKGTMGNVLEIMVNDDGSKRYLIELDNEKYPDGVVDYFSEDEIEKI